MPIAYENKEHLVQNYLEVNDRPYTSTDIKYTKELKFVANFVKIRLL